MAQNGGIKMYETAERHVTYLLTYILMPPCQSAETNISKGLEGSSLLPALSGIAGRITVG